jgi:hypothetical protein
MSRYYRTLLATLQDKLLLDAFQNAAVAFSLRKLRKDYTGDCIEVRRSSDNATQDIGFVNGELDTASLLSFVGAGSGFVRTWYDQSGNARNAIQTTNSEQPRIVNSGVLDVENTKPSLLLNGTNNSFSIANFQTSSYVNISLFSVVNALNTTGIRSIFTKNNVTGDNRSFFFVIRGGEWSSNLSGNGQLPIIRIDSTNNSPSGQNIFSSIINMSQSTVIDKINFYRNSNVASKTVVNTANLTSLFNANIPFEIGSSNGGTSNFFDGFIQEIIFYESGKTSERLGIETNINKHYNVF